MRLPSFLRHYGIFILAFGWVFLPPTLHAAPAKTPPAIAAVIDVQRILQESLSAKSVQQQLESYRAHFQTQIENEENDLRKAENELSKTRDQMPAATYSDHEQQLRQKFLTVERHVEARRKVLDQAFTDSMNTVRASLLEIVDQVAHEHGANLIVVKQQTLWADPGLEVTDEVLQRLNQKLPRVSVILPPEDKEEGKK